MKDGIIISLLSIIPKNATARFMGYSARIKLPRFLHKLLIRSFIWKYGVNMEESISRIEDFHTLSDFFLRRLKEGVHKVDNNPENWISPVDGTIHHFGNIEKGKFRQSESKYGSVKELLGPHDDAFAPQRYESGSYMIIYLSPKDYHRVHTHQEGILRQIRYMPGRLWPVFPAATRNIDSLFDRNERMLFELESSDSTTVLAMIGAFGVGRMGSSFVDIETNAKGPQRDFTASETIKRGTEMGYFALGSTVILLWPEQNLHWMVQKGNPIRMGECIASRTQSGDNS